MSKKQDARTVSSTSRSVPGSREAIDSEVPSTSGSASKVKPTETVEQVVCDDSSSSSCLVMSDSDDEGNTEADNTEPDPRIKDWSLEDKLQLYLQLIKLGKKPLAKLYRTIPTKTPAEIDSALQYFNDINKEQESADAANAADPIVIDDTPEEEQDPRIRGWSPEERALLYLELVRIGSKPRTKLHCKVPTKTPAEVDNAIRYFNDFIKALKAEKAEPIVIKTPDPEEVKSKARAAKAKLKRDGERQFNAPITNWANFLSEHIEFAYLETQLSESIRLFAKFGDIPQPHQTDNVNFREMYLILADALEGKPIVYENDKYKEIIREVIIGSAEESVDFEKTPRYDHIFNKLFVNESNEDKTAIPSSDEELSALRHIIAQKCYNPLNFTEEDLREKLDSDDDSDSD